MTDPTPQTTPARDEAVPAGWKLVPVEPTEEMIEAMCDAYRQTRRSGVSGMTLDAQFRAEFAQWFAAYSAMLASAPAPASGGVEAVAVKALEWVKTIGGAYVAAAFDGHYQVAERIDDKGWNCSGPNHETIALGVALHIAKAEAQADYERRSTLSPAATPVSEAGGGATGKPTLQVADIPRAPNTGRYLAETNDGRLLYLNHANEWQEMPNILAEPASSPAGGDVALRALYEWYDRDGSVGGASEVFEKHRATLSQSTSAGRVGE